MAVLLLLSDWWLPSVLPVVLRQWGVEMQSVSHVESGTWELLEVSYESEGSVVSVDVARVPSAWHYAQAYWRGEVGESLQISVRELAVELSGSSSESGAADESMDVVEIFAGVRAVLSECDVWLPAATIDVASILVDDVSVLTFSEVSFRDWQLAGLVESSYVPPSPLRVKADLSEPLVWALDVRSKSFGLGAEGWLNFEDTGRVSADVVVLQGGESLLGQAVWRTGERIPGEVLLKSGAFTVQPRWLPVLGAEQVRMTDLNVVWGEGDYRGTVSLETQLPIESHDAFPLEASLSVSGDFDVLSVERCELSGAWGDLALTNTLEVDLNEKAVLTGAQLVASLDLEEQDWIPATGHLEGFVSVGPDSSDGLDLRFDLTGENLSYGESGADGVQLAGEVQGTVITLSHLQLDLIDDSEADRVLVTGAADWAKRTMDLKYEASFGADWLNAVLREKYFVDALRGEGRVFGSFDNPEMQGQLEPVTLSHPLLHPVTLAGEVRSLSEGVIDVNLTADCGGARVLLDLAARRSDGVCSVAFEKVVISDPVLPTVELVEPAVVTYHTEAEFGQRLRVEPFFLESESSAAHVTWDAAKGVTLLIRNMSSTRIDRWLRQDFPLHDVDMLDVRLTQLQPKILGSVAVHAQAEASGGEMLRLDCVGQIEKQGLVLEMLEVKFDSEMLLSGALALPLRLQVPHEELPLWVSIPEGHLSGDLTGQTTPEFLQWLADFSDVSAGEAALKLSLSGFWTDPQGALDVHLAGIDLGGLFPDAELPRVTDLALVSRLGVDSWEVERLECSLNDSRVQGEVSVPTAEILEVLDAWPEEALNWEPLLEHLSGRVTLLDWKFEDWRHHFSPVMRGSGELDGELVLEPGLDLSGRLVLDDFALRPTSAYSMIDQIGAALELSDRKVVVQRASARVGGSPVTVGGWIDASDWDEPLWELTAVGKRVPLVRTNDLILRSDADLVLKRLASEDVPELSGQLDFTQSTLLVEFDPLAPSVESGPSSQPPYFSITTPTIADWEFNVVGKGDAFFRVRSPYFRAMVSANLALGGTFVKPEIIGSLSVASGDILFPSVKMELDSGQAFIEPTRPNEVQLDFSGIAQVSSYVITMEVEQTLEDPSVYFSSTPTLPNSEIVRLLATGGLSGGEVGAVGVYLGKGLLGVGAGGVDSSLADRLTFDVGEAGGRDGANTFGVQYQMTDDLYLRGGYDIYEAHNLDLLWSIFKR